MRADLPSPTHPTQPQSKIDPLEDGCKPKPPTHPPPTPKSMDASAYSAYLEWEHPLPERLRLNALIFFLAFLCSAGIGLSSSLKVSK